MQSIFPLAGAALVFLEVLGGITSAKIFPIGGTHMSQMAVVFGIAFVLYEVFSAILK